MAWPITRTDLRSALKYTAAQGDDALLDLYCAAVTEAIKKKTGIDVEPDRHKVGGVGTPPVGGTLPAIFELAARETAKLWWQQSFNGPGGNPTTPDNTVPMGAAFPRRVEGWLADYPAPAGFA